MTEIERIHRIADVPRLEEIEDELLVLVKAGMLDMSVDHEGSLVFWPTPRGQRVLHMSRNQNERVAGAT